jgi:hypothetical protein
MLKPIACALAGAAALAPMSTAAAQPPLAPERTTITTPVAPPAAAVSQIGPHTFVVTAVPGLTSTQTIQFQRFADYDLNRDGAYGPMEFAQAMYFLATGDPVPQMKGVPSPRSYRPHIANTNMDPKFALALINTASDEFTAIDANHDWRITPDELGRAARS